MRLELSRLPDLTQLQIQFDRVVSASGHGETFAAKHRHGRQVGKSGGINNDSLNASFLKRLAAEIKQARLQIEQVREIKFPHLRSGTLRGCLGDLGSDAGRPEGKFGHRFLIAHILDLFHLHGMQRRAVHNRGMTGVEFPERSNQADCVSRDIELQAIAGRPAQSYVRSGTRETAPAKAILGLHRARVWERGRRGGSQGCLPGGAGRSRAEPNQEKEREQPGPHRRRAWITPQTSFTRYSERPRHPGQYDAGQEKTRGDAACLPKKLRSRYGFFGVVAGAAAGLVAGFSVAGFSVVVVAGFLLRAVMMSVVKSVLSLEYRSTSTPFMLGPDLSKTRS